MIEKVSTIYGLYHDVAEIQPDHSLYRFNNKSGEITVTYGEMDELLKKMTCAFKHMNIAGKKVIVMGETSVQWIATYMATVFAGGVIVPLDPGLLHEEIINFINLSEAKVVVYSNTFEALFKDREAEMPSVEKFVMTNKALFTLEPDEDYVDEK
jgi:long-chain acyl-CoA synthetase